MKQRLGEKRRTRLLQVREQERGLARKMCKNVQARKENEQKALDEQIEALLAKESQQELRQLESLYNSRVRQMGKGHRDAYRISQVCIMSSDSNERLRAGLKYWTSWCAVFTLPL